MLQNLKTAAVLAEEFLGIKRKIEPLETRLDELKVALRGFGPEQYVVPGVGTVKVSKPGEKKLTGQKLVVDETKLSTVDPRTLSKLLKSGFLAWEDQYSRATASKVEGKFDA